MSQLAATTPVTLPGAAAVAPVGPIPQRIAALYVGDLAPQVTESTLFELFKQAGSVQSIRVCRDSSTRASLGYAYVNFQQTAEAEKAIETLNHTRLDGRPIRIAWSQRDPSARRSNIGNTFIKNLDSSIDSLGLEEMFGTFGKVVSCKVQTNQKGESLGYGFVQFESNEIATKAIESMNGKCLNDKKIFMGPFISRKDRPSASTSYTNLYVKELPSDTTEESFQELFKPYGTITSYKLMNGGFGPFGFVNYEKHEEALNAVKELNGKEIGQKKLYVARSQTRAERDLLLSKRREEMREKTKDCNIYVKGFPTTTEDKTLEEAFSPCGTITSAKIMREADNTSKGFGFVCFSKKEEAAEALITIKQVDGKPVEVAIAQRKEERRAQQMARRLARERVPYTPSAYGAHFPPLANSHPMSFGKDMRGFAATQQFMPPNFQSVYQDLVAVIATEHPASASTIANMIMSGGATVGAMALHNPALLQERVKQCVASLDKNNV